VWWWFFERCEQMTDAELFDDAESIAGLVAVGTSIAAKKSQIHTLSFPPQQYKLKAGDEPTDPATKKAPARSSPSTRLPARSRCVAARVTARCRCRAR
jgi:hypothetical protein